MYSVSETVARVLAPNVDTYFGVMGNGNAWFVDALERLDCGIIPVRHEVGTVAAADAYHRVTGKIAVATTTYGPGFTNTITALVESAKSRVPMLLVTGSAPQDNPRPWDIDQAALAASFGVKTFTVTPKDVAQKTREALYFAARNRIAVVLEIPYDLAASKAIDPELETILNAVPYVPKPDAIHPRATQVHDVAKLLTDATNPLILAGRGAKSASHQVIALANHLHADVATTAPAQGLFNVEGKFRDLGICGGFAAENAAEEIRRADVVLVIGAGLNQFTTAFGEAFGETTTVIQIDVEQQATHACVNYFLHGSAIETVEALIAELALERAPRKRDSVALLAREDGDALAPDGRLDPRSLMREINDALPAERIVVTDGGHFIGWANTYLDVPAADHMVLLGTATQSIGLGFNSAVGVATAAGKDKMSVLVTGDGGGLMAMADAESFIRQAHRGVIVVINDAAYGAEIHQYGTKGLQEEPMLIPEVDFATILAGMGARSQVVRTLDDLSEFQEWVNSGEPGTYALDCRVSRAVIAPYMQEFIR